MKKLLFILLASALCLTACGRASSPSTTVSSVDGSNSPTAADFSKSFLPKERRGEVNTADVTAEGEYITGNYTTVSGEVAQKYPRLTNQATLYLEFPEGKNLSSVRHGKYSPATYTFVDEYVENSYYNLPLQIKGRGNASWSLKQKAYSIKLDEKANLLDMGAAKKFALISVGSDMSMMRNYLTQKLAAAMGLPYTCENEYVDVVVNGKYMGTWVMTEKIQIHKERVDISEETGVLFEIEMVYRHTCDVCVVLHENQGDPTKSVHLTLKEYHNLEIDEIDESQKTAIQKSLEDYFQPLNQVIFDKRSTLEDLSRYIDIDSFVNWYLLNELTYNFDSQFVTSCYCFIGDNGKLYMGPVWDYDSCYGNQGPDIEGYRVKKAPWYSALLAKESFKALCDKRWTEIRDNGLLDAFHDAIALTAERIAESEKMNHTLYPTVAYRNEPFEESVTYFQGWVRARIQWMDIEFLLPDSPSYTPPPATTRKPGATRPAPSTTGRQPGATRPR